MLSWGPKYPLQHEYMHPCITIDTRMHVFMLSCCLGQSMTPPYKCCSRNWALFCFVLFFVQMQWSYANCSLFPVLSCGLPIKGSTWCAFRDAFLHTMVLTSGYLSYHCLSICLSQSAHSLTSSINKAFSLTDLLLTGYFLFFPDNSL